MADWKIPLSALDFDEEELEAVARVIRSEWLSMGPEVQAFEAEFAAFQEAKRVFAVSSATAALHLALLALDIGPGDEVIQPALNFVAAANMTIACGATPVFADIAGIDQPCIDPEHVARLISPRTKAVVAMHYGGTVSRVAELTNLCRENDLTLIEDACHAIGAHGEMHDGGPGPLAGSFGDIGTFSFFANKNLVTGEGGMLVTDDDKIAERVRLLRSHGMTTLTWDRHQGHANSYDVVANGFNYRMDELHAALGRAQLKKLGRNNGRRRAILERYQQELAGCAGWTMPFAEDVARSSAHLMVAVAKDREMRDRTALALRDLRIQSSLHYPCIADFTAFERYQQSAVPLSRLFASRALTLPCFPTMTAEQVTAVVEVLRAAE